jgi:hypothetical protein
MRPAKSGVSGAASAPSHREITVLLNPHAQVRIAGILAAPAGNPDPHQPFDKPLELAKIRGRKGS